MFPLLIYGRTVSLTIIVVVRPLGEQAKNAAIVDDSGLEPGVVLTTEELVPDAVTGTDGIDYKFRAHAHCHQSGSRDCNCSHPPRTVANQELSLLFACLT
jgi:hypothetical protein